MGPGRARDNATLPCSDAKLIQYEFAVDAIVYAVVVIVRGTHSDSAYEMRVFAINRVVVVVSVSQFGRDTDF